MIKWRRVDVLGPTDEDRNASDCRHTEGILNKPVNHICGGFLLILDEMKTV